jgi:septal ring factor EnvC (AmiA/AmiB activator)
MALTFKEALDKSNASFKKLDKINPAYPKNGVGILKDAAKAVIGDLQKAANLQKEIDQLMTDIDKAQKDIDTKCGQVKNKVKDLNTLCQKGKQDVSDLGGKKADYDSWLKDHKLPSDAGVTGLVDIFNWGTGANFQATRTVEAPCK